MKYNYAIRSKINDFNQSVYAQFSKSMYTSNAIDIARGYSEMGTPDILKEKAASLIGEGRTHYTRVYGHLKLREEIARYFENKTGLSYMPDKEVTITAGVTEGIYSTITSLIREGDEVIVIEPAYDAYTPIIELCGGKVVYVNSLIDNFKVDWKGVQQAINPRTRMIVLNDPHNPTGALFTAKDLATLARIVNGTDIIILSDETMESLVYNGKKHVSLMTNLELAERTVFVSGFGKLLSTTGWRIGFCLAPENLTREIRKIHHFAAFNANSTFQYALADSFSQLNFEEYRLLFQERRNYFINALKQTKLTVKSADSGIYLLASYENISDMKDADFSNKLITDHKVATVPVSAFMRDKSNTGHLRLCFARPIDVLDKAIEKLMKL
ncbi:MAG: aminotransferase class I/II-fold pyridoxal phosphate-dependent enzyme [Salinivirgaceae bacterium]|nr:aminotransferase class I/II-fold pyridoxal phosphate-dependent enzyme [Salinivirgaceae bacterium]